MVNNYFQKRVHVYRYIYILERYIDILETDKSCNSLAEVLGFIQKYMLARTFSLLLFAEQWNKLLRKFLVEKGKIVMITIVDSCCLRTDYKLNL